MTQHHRIEIHFWTPNLDEPPCGTLEDRFVWTDDVEDVTCDSCREALTGDGGTLSTDRHEDHPLP